MYIENTETTGECCKVCIMMAEKAGMNIEEIKARCVHCKLVREPPEIKEK